jgi:hypothetical protein
MHIHWANFDGDSLNTYTSPPLAKLGGITKFLILNLNLWAVGTHPAISKSPTSRIFFAVLEASILPSTTLLTRPNITCSRANEPAEFKSHFKSPKTGRGGPIAPTEPDVGSTTAAESVLERPFVRNSVVKIRNTSSREANPCLR